MKGLSDSESSDLADGEDQEIPWCSTNSEVDWSLKLHEMTAMVFMVVAE